MLPTVYPVNVTTLNWTPVVLGLVLTLVLVAWYVPRCGARHWYHGKAHTLDDENVVRGVPSQPACPLRQERHHTVCRCAGILTVCLSSKAGLPPFPTAIAVVIAYADLQWCA